MQKENKEIGNKSKIHFPKWFLKVPISISIVWILIILRCFLDLFELQHQTIILKVIVVVLISIITFDDYSHQYLN